MPFKFQERKSENIVFVPEMYKSFETIQFDTADLLLH